MFLGNLNAEIVACILLFRKSRHKLNLESTSKYGFSPDLGGKNGGVLSMRMQVILDSSFACPGSAPIKESSGTGLVFVVKHEELCFYRSSCCCRPLWGEISG